METDQKNNAVTEPGPARAAKVNLPSDQAGAIESLIELAKSLLRSNPAEARAWAEEALALARSSGEPRLIARSLIPITVVAFNSGRLAEVNELGQEALELALRTGDAYAEYKSTNWLGLAAQRSGDRKLAIRRLEQSVQAAQRLNDDKALAVVFTNLGDVLRENGDLERALEVQFNALRLHERLKRSLLVGHSHLNIGAIYGELGDWEKAVEYFYRALVEFERDQDKQGMAWCHINIAEIYLKRGKYDRVVQSAEKAARYAEEAQSPFPKLVAMGHLGEACLLAGDPVRARTIFDQNIEIARQLKIPAEEATNLVRKAELLMQEVPRIQGASPDSLPPRTLEPSLTEALQLLNQALPLVESGASQIARAGVLRALGRACALSGDRAKARASFESSAALLKDTRGFDLALVYFDFGRFLVEQKEKPAGLQMVRDAARIFKRLEMIAESETTERYLFQMDTEQDRRLSILRSLSSLTSHSLPLSEFAPRCLTVLRDALGFSSATFSVEGGGQWQIAGGRPAGQQTPADQQSSAACLELAVTDDRVCLPLRLSGRNVGGIRLQWEKPGAGGPGPESGAEPLAPEGPQPRLPVASLDPSFLEIVSNLLSVAMERNRTEAVPGGPWPGAGPGQPPSAAEPSPQPYPGFVGRSRAILAILRTVEQVAPTNACVLIQGDSGTGKELIARMVHDRSTRRTEDFVAFNCAAIPETLVESELFGIEKGVATGVTERRGKFEQASRGTLFLDEIGDMTLLVQAKLLRVLQERQVERIGGRKLIEVDTRIIAASNKNLEKAVQEGKFRQDLYYRLNVISIVLPPLSERRDDIPLMANTFLQTYNEEFQRRVRGISPEVLEVFLIYPWPGNVRELLHVIERAVILCRSDLIQVEDLPPALQAVAAQELSAGDRSGLRTTSPQAPTSITDLRDLRRKTQESATAVLEKNLLETALKETNWNAAQAARQLGISRSHFYRLLEKYGLKREADE